MQDDKKRLLMIIALVVLFIVLIRIPTPDNLPYEGQRPWP